MNYKPFFESLRRIVRLIKESQMTPDELYTYRTSIEKFKFEVDDDGLEIYEDITFFFQALLIGFSWLFSMILFSFLPQPYASSIMLVSFIIVLVPLMFPIHDKKSQ